MRGEASCPKCGGRVRAPGLFSHAWQCRRHGAVHPVQPVVPPGADAIAAVLARTLVPVWMPWPLPVGWVLTGVASAGDDQGGGRASAIICSGPNPSGGTTDLLLVAEEPGVGLGARYAGVLGDVPTPRDSNAPAAGAALPATAEVAEPPGRDHGKREGPPAPSPQGDPSIPHALETPHAAGLSSSAGTATPQRTVLAAGGTIGLRPAAGTPEDRTAFHGTADGWWLWVVYWPPGAALLHPDDLVIADLRTAGEETDLIPCGNLSPRLLS